MITARRSVKQGGKYDMAQVLNSLSEKAVLKNWDIRTMAVQLKDGSIISNSDIQRFVQQQKIRSQGIGWGNPEVEYTMKSPATWRHVLDQTMPADNNAYWVMRMTGLTYVLIQRFHENQSNQKLESGMLALDPPEWSNPATLHSLFSEMTELWSRIEPDRRAVSLLEDSMYSVISQNNSHGPYMRAEYNHKRKEAKRIVAAESGMSTT